MKEIKAARCNKVLARARNLRRDENVIPTRYFLSFILMDVCAIYILLTDRVSKNPHPSAVGLSPDPL